MHPPEPKPASVVVLRRSDGRVYLVKRPRASRFFPGHHAFPGGRLEPEDGDRSEPLAFARCAARELEEEVLVRVDPERLVPAGVTVTPPFSPIRYHTQFFLADLPDDQEPDPQAPELAGGEWLSPLEALDAFRTGKVRLPPPVMFVLETAARHGFDVLAEAGTEVRSFPIRFARGLRVEPLAVRTLPPHTHTNCFILGDEELAVVDPGADGEPLDRLIEALEELVAEGARVSHVVLTHHHGDHTEGAAALLERFGAKLACTATCGKLIGSVPDVVLADQDRIELAGGHTIVALETPGHAPGHLALLLPDSHALLPGDLVAGIGSVLVAPPEGDMAAYFASVERLLEIVEEHGVRLLFPAHGPPAFDPARTLNETLDHRRTREQRVLAAVADGAHVLDAIAEAAYANTPDAPEVLARLSTQAHLDKLVQEGRLVRDGEAWQLAA